MVERGMSSPYELGSGVGTRAVVSRSNQNVIHERQVWVEPLFAEAKEEHG